MRTVPVSFSAIAPEIVLVVAASLLLAGAIFLPRDGARRISGLVAALAFVGAGIASVVQWDDAARYAFDGTVRIDAFGQGGRLLVFAAGLLSVATSWGMGRMRERAVEYHALLLCAGAGMSLLTVSNSFVTVFVALELFSVALYVLVAIDVDELWSLEGGLKYLIIGSVGAAFLLYGAALVYGASGELEFQRIRDALAGGDANNILLLLGIGLVIVGLGFKANAAPFHMWTPDAYEGAPTSITGFMGAATKVTALVTTMRVLVSSFPDQSRLWENALAGIAIASFVVGNLAALRQTNVKRMLAYSTVGHSGFLLTAVAARSELGGTALMYYLAIYGAVNIGAFAIVALREREIGRQVQIADFAGWGYRRPWLAAAMLVFLITLAGFPPTGGFVGKLLIFSAAWQNGQWYLAVAGVIATMVSLVYYLRIPTAMYDRDAEVPEARRTPGFELASGATALAAGAVIVLGIVPTPLLDLARHAGGSLPF